MSNVEFVDMSDTELYRRAAIAALSFFTLISSFTIFVLFLADSIYTIDNYRKNKLTQEETSIQVQYTSQTKIAGTNKEGLAKVTESNIQINEQLLAEQNFDTLSENASSQINNPDNIQTSQELSTALVLPKRIKIPILSKDLPVLNPKNSNMQILDQQLLHGVVRYPKTATLDMERGNVLIFGHSSHLPVVRNQMFRALNDIEKLKKGAKIVLVGDDGREYVYKTRYVKKVSADNSSVLIDTDNKQLTLITCENFGSKQDRWVLVADFADKR